MRSNYSSSRFGPSSTPSVVKSLVKVIAIFSLLSSLITMICGKWMGLYSPQPLFGLSTWGIDHLFLWQFVTYIFTTPGNLSFSFVVYLAFTLYLLWVAGTAVVDRVGKKPFLRLFFLSGIVGGICAWLALLGLPSLTLVAGSMAALYGLLFAWMMLYPHAQVMLMMAFPIKMRTLIPGMLAFNVLMCLGDQQFAEIAAYVGGALTGYIYALIAWNLDGPYNWSRPFDEAMANFGVKMRQLAHRFRGGRSSKRTTIVDFQTGRVVNHE